jgi:excinuclease UvrABC ATPase subunit
MNDDIVVRRARVNNLDNVSLEIPKRKLTVFTGVSGSGKSSLVFGTIAAESQRLINETYPAYVQSALPRYGQPDADQLENLSAAVVVDQQRLGGNPRSTVGTVTDTYTLLRLLYSRAGTPQVDNPKVFSFNDPAGMCSTCEGLGRSAAVDLEQLVDRTRSLNQGAIQFPTFAVGGAHWNFFVSSGLFDNDKPLADFSEQEWETFLYGPSRRIEVVTGGKTSRFTYEGLVPKFKRLYLSKGADQIRPNLREAFNRVVTTASCDDCGGSRLGPTARACQLNGTSIVDCVTMEVRQLREVVAGITDATVAPVVADLVRRLDGMVDIGLGYLSLGRETATLSGGESQRLKTVRHLGSSLTDMIYIFDEPTVGLHPHDVHRLNQLLRQLRDKGNTVLVVEHEPEVMAIADLVVDMGPGAGRDGGRVVYTGPFDKLAAAEAPTGRYLNRELVLKQEPRQGRGHLRVTGARLNNLQDVSVDIPTGVLTVVTGVAGAGKSSLIRGWLPRQHPDTVVIDQSLPKGSRRSNPATYTGMLDLIRKEFARANRVDAALFSANSSGACADCQGLGLIYTDLAHLDPVATTCGTCEGRRFNSEVLQHTLRGRNISDVLELSVDEALEYFTESAIRKKLTALHDVGLGYLTLWQPVSTLSGGERQRLKLANQLDQPAAVYVIDEPTAGLHMQDVDVLVGLLDRFVDRGCSMIVIEHNLDVVARADWVIDVGPGAGSDGGRIVYAGPPAGLLQQPESLTGQHLRQRLAAG